MASCSMDLETYRRRYGPADSPGVDAIDAALDRLYARRTPDAVVEPRTGPRPRSRTVGEAGALLERIRFYRRPETQTPHLHAATYGFSELHYEEASIGEPFSRWGFELTLRVAVDPEMRGDPSPPAWAVARLQDLARYVWRTERWFEAGCHIGFKTPLAPAVGSALRGFLVTPDPELPQIDTPHGSVSFLQLVGLTGGEIEALQAGRIDANGLAQALKRLDPLCATDLRRKDSVV